MEIAGKKIIFDVITGTKPGEIDLKKLAQLNELKYAKICGDLNSNFLLKWKTSDYHAGLIYREEDTNKILGFTLFKTGIFNGVYFMKGSIRCSSVKGIGRHIEEQMEEFAKNKGIKFIEIEPAEGLIPYYTEKFGYQQFNFKEAEGMLFKFIDKSFTEEDLKKFYGVKNNNNNKKNNTKNNKNNTTKGGRCRKTRRVKKSKKHTRKHK